MRLSGLAFLASVAFIVPLNTLQAQSCQQICDAYLAFARTAGAPGTMARLQQMYQACISCQRGVRPPPSSVPPAPIYRTNQPTRCAQSVCYAGSVCVGGWQCMRASDMRKVFGTQVTTKDARRGLPYALMSRHAYGKEAGGRPAPSIAKIGDSGAVLRRAGFSKAEVEAAKASGFHADLFKNSRSGEVTIAFRGSEVKISQYGDWYSNVMARLAGRARPSGAPPQYGLAELMTRQVQKDFGVRRVSLTGHSLGGALASYAGARTGAAKVVTFNGAVNPYSSLPGARSQINFIVSGDIVGDVMNNKLGISKGILPGRTVRVPTFASTSGLYGATLGRHDLNGMIGGLAELARRRAASGQQRCFAFNGQRYCR